MHKDLVIIGAGPAGLAAAIYGCRNGLDVALLDPMGAGGQLMYIYELENYPGFDSISGYELSAKLEKQCAKAGTEVEFVEVQSISKKDGLFIIKTDGEEYTSKAVIIATGAKHRLLNVKGEEEYTGHGVSYCATCDGPFFKGKRAVVVGGGDTALTDALYLSRILKEVTIIHRRDEFRAQKVLQNRVREKENINIILSDNVTEIIGDGDKVTSVRLKSGRTIDTDSVFIFVGMDANSELFKDLCTLQNGYILTDDKMATTTPGLFAAGDVRTTNLRQVVTASADGALAAQSASEYILNIS